MGDSKQTKLLDEPLPNIANERTIRKPMLSATTLAAWFICRTRPFLQRVLERLRIDTSTPTMRAGSAAHEAVQGALEAVLAPTEDTMPQALQKGSFLLANEMHLVDDQLKLHGYADIVYARGGKLHVLELKNMRAPPLPDPLWRVPVRSDHGVQLHVYGVAANAMFGQSPKLFLSYLQSGSKRAVLDELTNSRNPETAIARFETESVALPHGLQERTLVRNEARLFFRAEAEIRVPAPNHADPVRCKMCGVRQWCPARLDRPGEFIALSSEGLGDA